MDNLYFSRVTNKQYDVRKIVRIMNPQQCCFYLRKHADLLDVYTTKSLDEQRDLLVFCFDREATKDLYDKWCKHETD